MLLQGSKRDRKKYPLSLLISNWMFYSLYSQAFLRSSSIGEKDVEWEATGWQRSTGKLNLSEWGKDAFLYHNLVGLRDILKLPKGTGKTHLHVKYFWLYALLYVFYPQNTI